MRVVYSLLIGFALTMFIVSVLVLFGVFSQYVGTSKEANLYNLIFGCNLDFFDPIIIILFLVSSIVSSLLLGKRQEKKQL